MNNGVCKEGYTIVLYIKYVIFSVKFRGRVGGMSVSIAVMLLTPEVIGQGQGLSAQPKARPRPHC